VPERVTCLQDECYPSPYTLHGSYYQKTGEAGHHRMSYLGGFNTYRDTKPIYMAGYSKSRRRLACVSERLTSGPVNENRSPISVKMCRSNDKFPPILVRMYRANDNSSPILVKMYRVNGNSPPPRPRTHCWSKCTATPHCFITTPMKNSSS
jgi:hypothetical protein